MAPIHVVIVPIYRKDDEKEAVLAKAAELARDLREDGLTVELDDREELKPGAKYYEWERKGVPLRLEVGPRDLEAGTVMAKRRISGLDEKGRAMKETLPMADLGVHVGRILDEFQDFLYQRAKTALETNTHTIDNWKDFEAAFADGKSSFVWAHWDGTTETELKIKEQTKATIRCLALPGSGPEPEAGNCILTGAPSAQRVLFAKNY
jgi:prolyl-tRNA synthetase